MELVNCLYSIFARGERKADIASLEAAVPQRFVYSVKDKSRELLKRLSQGRTSLTTLILECGSKTEIIATFLSILEMCSMGSVQVLMDEEAGYTVEFIGGSTEEILEKIVEN